MAVVKADAYGHGAVPCARAAAKQAGAAWLGTALPEEALQLRAAGLTGPILAWLHPAGGPVGRADRRRTSTSPPTPPGSCDEITAAAQRARRPARVQLKADTGLGRGGTQPHDWLELVELAAKAEAAGHVRVTGVWSHFACADEPGHPSIGSQLDLLPARAGRRRPGRAAARGPAHRQQPGDPEPAGVALRPGPPWAWRSTASRPCRTPPAADFGLRPAMTLRGAAWRWSRTPRPGTACPTGTSTTPAPRRRWPWSRSATPTACPATPPTSARS